MNVCIHVSTYTQMYILVAMCVYVCINLRYPLEPRRSSLF